MDFSSFTNFRPRIPKVTLRWKKPGYNWKRFLPGRYFLTVVIVVANSFITITGLVFLMLGMVCLFLQNLLSSIPVLKGVYWYPGQLLTTSVCIMAVAVLGYVAVWKRARYALAAYASVLTVIVVVQMCMVVQSQNVSVQTVTEGWVTYAYNNPVLRLPFHLLEITMRCCGAEGKENYISLPATCCNLHETCTTANAFSGCAGTISKYVQKISFILGSLTSLAVGTEIIIVLASLYLIYIWSYTGMTLPKL